MSELPKWPEPPGGGRKDQTMFRAAKYEQARADAAVARLRVAVAVLMDVRQNALTIEDAVGYATNALIDIGELP